jgi:large subunit ribosomal protein L13
MSYTAGTSYAKVGEIKKAWFVVDAKDLVLGRFSAEIAKALRGKTKPSYTPHLDCGDHVVVINAGKVALTGKKREQSIFHWHTGHPGGVKERTKGEILDSKFPERVVEKAVERMMPKDSPLARKQMKCLHVYSTDAHPHEAQSPQLLDLAARNSKNKRNKKG